MADNDIQQQDAAQAAVPAGEQQRPGAFEIFKSIASRMLIMYIVMNAMNYFKSRPNDTNTPSSSPQTPMGNMFSSGSLFDMYVYISENDKFTQFSDEKSLVWNLEEIEYGNWSIGPNNDGTFTKSLNVQLTENMVNNGSIYMHVYMTEHGRSPNPLDSDSYSKKHTFSSFKSDTEKDADYQQKAENNVIEILSYWHPNLTINLIDDHTPWQKNAVPPPINDFIEFEPLSGKYYPVIYFNDYWNLNADYYPINSTLTHLDLHLTFSPLQLWKWQLYLSQSTRNQFLGGMLQEDSNEEDQDTMKRTLLETSPYLLALTVIVTLVHNVFEFLAFKNDIQFWRNRKSLEGLSVNSVLFGCLTQLIVLLYVLDNDTNTIVKISIGIGLLIELWKVPKVCTINFDYDNKLFGLLPRLKLIYKTSYTKSNTQDYDKLAFKYLSWILFPLVISYGIYSLVYNEHKSWYSFVLSMLYGFLLTFGFIMMTPQLFINYKLKSVAHLPWRMLTYKALNTFIDDIFAFIIKMPTMYRLGCLRDDIIFFIYLYQRYIYKVDNKRTNEFGTSGETDVQVESIQQEETQQNTNTTDHLKSE